MWFLNYIIINCCGCGCVHHCCPPGPKITGPLLLLVIGIIRKSNYFISVGVATLLFSSLGITSEYLTKYVESPYVRLDEADVDQADAIVVLSGNREYLINRSKIVE